MRPTLLLLLLAACGGPDVSGVVDTYESGGLTFQSELPFAHNEPGNGERIGTTWVDSDVAMVRAQLDAAGVLPAAAFTERFAGITVIIRDAETLEEGRYVFGKTSVRPGITWVEMVPDGRSLGHELLHVMDLCRHDARRQWEREDHNAADRAMEIRAMRRWAL